MKSEVLNVAPRWRPFGIALHINPPSLDLRVPEEGLSYVLKEFLQKKYNFKKYGIPSWKLIVAAVRRKEGGNDKDLALEIARNHLTIVTRGTYIYNLLLYMYMYY